MVARYSPQWGQTVRGNCECTMSGHSLTCECSLLAMSKYCNSEGEASGPVIEHRRSPPDWWQSSRDRQSWVWLRHTSFILKPTLFV